MKLCKNCAYFSKGDLTCRDRSALRPDYVMGEHGYFYASTMRENDTTGCGHDAKYFEEKNDANQSQTR